MMVRMGARTRYHRLRIPSHPGKRGLVLVFALAVAAVAVRAEFHQTYHSFPSGQLGTSFGTATALAVMVPAIGIPALAGAAVIGWSRMYVREHYLTDVIVGASLGVFFGWAFGITARRRRSFQPAENQA